MAVLNFWNLKGYINLSFLANYMLLANGHVTDCSQSSQFRRIQIFNLKSPFNLKSITYLPFLSSTHGDVTCLSRFCILVSSLCLLRICKLAAS